MMSGIIRLDRHSDDGVLDISLKDLLDVIGEEGEDLSWAILSLWARGDLTSTGTTMKDLEARVEGTPEGVQMSWAELKAFAGKVDEIMEGVFAAYPPGAPAPRLGPGLDPHAASVIVLELIDSGYWEVSCAEEKILKRLERLKSQS
jgi:hypothetical protein